MIKEIDFTNNLSSNLKYLMQATGITSVDLACIVGVSAESIGKIKNGSFTNPSLKVLTGISNHFKVPLTELVYEDLEHNKQKYINEPVSRIPIVDWSEIKNWKNEKSGKSLIIEEDLSKDIFALFINRPYGPFNKNSFILVDTSLKPNDNQYVLTLNIKTNTFNVKKLIIEDCSYLKSIMPDVNGFVEYNPNEYLIFGVIIGYQKTKFFKY